MIVSQTGSESNQEFLPVSSFPSFHPSFLIIYKKLKRWLKRFPFLADDSVFNDFSLLYLLATKKYLDHRTPSHLFHLVLLLHLTQKTLLRKSTFSPHLRHLEIRWIHSNLTFPFFSKPVLGCLIGFNVMDRYELFDEENILLALQKYLPQLRLVKDSFYCHNSQHKNLRIFYLEIENKDGAFFSLKEQNLLKSSLERKIKKSIQRLSPTIFMEFNEEEIYNNILTLSQEINSIQDLPQAHITLDQQTGKEVIFRVNLVHISPFHRFSLKDRFFDTTFVSERVLTVKKVNNHPVKAHIFCLHFSRDANLLRGDGSLDFYSARQKVVSLITAAIGPFRDYNGGILIKQQELFLRFKESFLELSQTDLELMELFFYSLVPLEKQVLLNEKTLECLFSYFLENQNEKLPPGAFYSFKIYREKDDLYLIIQGEEASLKDVILSALQKELFEVQDSAYSLIDVEEKMFFSCVISRPKVQEAETLIQLLQEALLKWEEKLKNYRILKIGLEYLMVSLDPRIGGEAASVDILKLLFEGLTRFDQNGNVENGVAESIEISPDLKEYTFKFRHVQWNDGSLVSAHDFAYAWKKILSPDFKTSFAYFFYCIKNAREAKEGKVSLDDVGIEVIDDTTLKVVLDRPTAYFLQLTAHPVYSPIHRIIDEQYPQWPYQCQQNYPCNGPFQLKINHPTQGYHLVKNSFYWDTDSILWDQIIMTYMSPLESYKAFQKKEIDWIGNPFGAWHPSYVPKKDDRVLSFKNSWVYWCVFNTKHPLFRHYKIRQAFAYAIHRAKIVAGSFLPLTAAYSPLLSTHDDNHNSLFPEHNFKEANRLFNEALKELGLRKEELPIFEIIFHQKGIREYTALCIKEQLKECLGIECSLKPLTSVFDKLTRGNFEIGLVHWNSWIDDPIYTLNAFKFAKEEINLAKWEHPEFQNLLELSDKEVNPFQRSYYLLKAEEILCSEMPIIPLFYQPTQVMVNKDLQVFYRAPCGPFNLSRSFFHKKTEVL
jgi:oligopeptide transport system substrate-binding protein